MLKKQTNGFRQMLPHPLHLPRFEFRPFDTDVTNLHVRGKPGEPEWRIMFEQRRIDGRELAQKTSVGGLAGFDIGWPMGVHDKCSNEMQDRPSLRGVLRRASVVCSRRDLFLGIHGSHPRRSATRVST